MKRAWLTFVLALPVACGGESGDGETADTAACESVVDAYATAWDRCGRLDYEDARELFSGAFACGRDTRYDQAEVEACVGEVQVMPCASVDQGATPASCRNVTASAAQ